jgi:hypothetical protein
LAVVGWAIAATAAAAPIERAPGAALDVTVSETAEAVEVRVFLASDLDPGSVEVQLGDRQVVVVARDADGHRRRSRPITVSAPLEEGDSRADYGPDGWLTVKVPKRVRGRSPSS